MDESTTLAEPTLFADDITATLESRDIDAAESSWDAIDAVMRILPRRCPGEEVVGHKAGHDECASRIGCPGCPICDGRGWLYPDMPDFMIDAILPQAAYNDWHDLSETVWRAMGILE